MVIDIDGGIFVIISVKMALYSSMSFFLFVKDGDENGVLVVSFEFVLFGFSMWCSFPQHTRSYISNC